MNEPAEERLLRLWVRNQADVYRYVFALLPNANEAQEVLQATCVALWQKAAQFDFDRPFLPLAFRFAVLEVRKHRQRNRRWAGMLSDELLDTLAQQRENSRELLELRRQSLDDCMAKLPSTDRDLIHQHYHRQMTIPQIAEVTGRNIHTLYKALQRIRRQLMSCIDSRIAAEGSL